MNSFKPLLLGLLFIFASCTNWKNLDKGLGRIQHIDQAISTFGPPQSSNKVNDRMFYTWSSSRSMTALMPTTTSYQGSIGNENFYGTSTSNQAMNLNYNAKIDFETDSNGKVIRYWYNGNSGGLLPYLKALERYGFTREAKLEIIDEGKISFEKQQELDDELQRQADSIKLKPSTEEWMKERGYLKK
jgi:hypothetical protein